MSNSMISKHAEILVKYSVEARKNSSVVIEGWTTGINLIKECYKQTLSIGAHPVVILHDENLEDIFYELSNEKQLKFVNPVDIEQLKIANCWITIYSCSNTKHLSSVKSGKISTVMQANKKFDDLWIARTCAYGKPEFMPRVTTVHPCHALAQDANMSLSQYERFVYNAGYLDVKNPTTKWRSIERKQKSLIKKLNRFRKFKFVCDDKNTNITFRVPKDRKWFTCAGKENFPDGEIYTAPDENSTEGKIQFSFPSIYNGVNAGIVLLEFRKGKVTKFWSDNQDYLKEMISQDEGACRVGELAFGLNERIKNHTKEILFDEKIGGTFHIALGDSYPNTGGTNKSQLHWDMICDLRNDGSVYGDGEPIYKKGKFLI